MTRRLVPTFIQLALASVLAFVVASGLTPLFRAPSAYACYTWTVGSRVGLKRGAEIREGSGLGYRVHTIVPEDNWQVDIIGGPRYADGQEWWDISRRNLDGGGTGWVYKAQAGYDLCGGGGDPPPSQPGRLILIQDLSVSPTNPDVNQDVSGTYRVKNAGGQAITLEYLGIQGRLDGNIDGTARDFHWIQNLTLQPGEEYTYSTNRSFDIAGRWRLRPNYKLSGGGWSDVHRDNGTINEVWITVGSSSPPSPPSGGGVTVDRAWTNDGGSNRSTAKTAFNPGDRIFYVGAVNNRTGNSVTARFVWNVRGPGGQIASWSGSLQTGAGVWWWWLPSTIPGNAAPGTYTYALSVTYNGQTSSRSTTFTVQGQQQPPTASVITERAWTADGSGNEKVRFEPRQGIKLCGNFRNNTTTTAHGATFAWDTYDSSGQRISALSHPGYVANVSPGSVTICFTTTVPRLPDGVYTLRVSSSYGAQTSSQSKDFTVGCTPMSGCVLNERGSNARWWADSWQRGGCSGHPDTDWLVTYKTDNETWRNAAPSQIRFSAYWRSKVRYGASRAQIEDHQPPGITICFGGRYSEYDVQKTWVWLKP